MDSRRGKGGLIDFAFCGISAMNDLISVEMPAHFPLPPLHFSTFCVFFFSFACWNLVSFLVNTLDMICI